jgi:hypothetical protein
MKAAKMGIDDRINFGELKGQSYIEIFKFNYTYLEWIIRKTEICFDDLDEFFKFGNPFDVSYNFLSQEAMEQLIKHISENNRLSILNEQRVNFENIKYLKESGIIKYKDLKVIDYNFPNDVVTINNNKITSIKSKK